MKNYLLLTSLGILVVLLACTKEKAVEIVDPANFLTAECPDTVKFSTKILPTMQSYCFGCHANGTSPTINNYQTIVNNASSMMSRMKASGSALMPQGGPALHDTLIQQFQCWINQGKLNN